MHMFAKYLLAASLMTASGALRAELPPHEATELTAHSSQGHEMAGEVLLPPGEGPVPVVMLISGTGRQQRDFAVMEGRYHPHRDLAERLLAEGIGVIRFDERNTGRSTGDHRTARSLDLQEDVRLILARAAQEVRVDRKRIYLFGHSEGAVFAMRLAASEPLVAGIAIAGAPFKSGRAMMRDQARIETPRAPDMSDAAWEAAVAEHYAAEIAFQETRPSLADLLDFDGAATAAAVTKPVLILEGEEDWQVRPPQGRQLAQAMRDAGNRDVAYYGLPHVGHLLTRNPPGVSDYHALADLSLAPEVLDALAGWVRRVAQEDG